MSDYSKYKSAHMLAQEQFAYDQELARQANEYNVQNWERQTEYNTPANQVKRLQAAGINPLFGQIDGNTAAPMDAAVKPSVPDLIGAYNAVNSADEVHLRKLMALASTSQQLMEAAEKRSNIRLQEAQMRNLALENDRIKAQTQNVQEDTRGRMIQNDFNQLRNEDKDAIRGYWNDIFARAKYDAKYQATQSDRQEMANFVTQAQINDPQVFNALVTMPKQQSEQLAKNIQMLSVQLKYANRQQAAEARIMEARASVEEFYKQCADNGMDPHAPWLAKFVGSLIDDISVGNYSTLNKIKDAVKHVISDASGDEEVQQQLQEEAEHLTDAAMRARRKHGERYHKATRHERAQMIMDEYE